jgi:hypothetical protein
MFDETLRKGHSHQLTEECSTAGCTMGPEPGMHLMLWAAAYRDVQHGAYSLYRFINDRFHALQERHHVNSQATMAALLLGKAAAAYSSLRQQSGI